MERGTYQWNAATNAFAYTVEVNTDGTGGLSNPNPTQTPPYTFVIDSGGNNAVLHFGPGPGNEIHLSRVVSSTNLLVGAWKLQVPFDVPFSAVVTSLPDGTFTYANDAFDTIAAQMERGTYTFDSVTGMLTMNITVDTSGPPSVDIVTANITEALGGDPDFLRLTEGGILRFSIV
ncbi:MAG: hypothetical protein K2X00_14910 [Nitrospiraceae bacterium]|nr:hypothetical protein [Nitrospiraceae bacterium]OQW63622.1 MAG: hypothetical protein BVN29_15880 [Nitrospira sp. ST-bin5]